MKDIKKILSLEIKEFARSYLIFSIFALIFAMILFSRQSSTDVNDYIISNKIIIAGFIILFVLLYIVLSTGKSMQDTFIMANKLGYSRKNISEALIIKDLWLILLSTLLVFYLSNFIIKKAELVSFIEYKDVEKIINNLGSFDNVLRICIIYLSFSNIFANIAYLVKSNPLSGSIFGMLILSIFNDIFLGSNGLINSTIFTLIIFILGQIIKYYVINKVDAKS